MKTGFILFLTLIAFSFTAAQTQKGIIKGKVSDLNSKEYLIGANVLVQGTTMGASTNENGEFTIPNVPIGNHTIRFSYIGYETIVKTDVVVRPERITFVNVELKQSAFQSDEISVTAGYFQNKDVSNVNAVNFNAEEIKRSPGSMGDVSRILLAMPSTAKVSDDQNDLAVRGGSPSENGFFVDGISVPNINHFPSIGATGGPIGILNIDFIDNVNFLTSGFSPKYGDRLSSIVDIQYREGNREKFEMQADLNLSGFGGGIEGPLPGGKGSWMISGKKSYLDIIMDLFFDSGAMPRMADLQGKVVYDINKQHKLSLLDIFAHNTEDFNSQDAIDLDSDDYGSIENIQNTVGLSWRALWNNNFYSITSASHSLITFTNEFFKVSTDELTYMGDNSEQYVNFRNINYAQLSLRTNLEFGVDFNRASGKYDYTRASDTTNLGTVNPTFVIKNSINPIKAGAFVNLIISPFNKLTFSLGLRNDWYSINNKYLFSPRFSISYDINDVCKIFTNGGIFYQRLPMVLLSQTENNERLSIIKAYHYGLGLEYLLNEDTKLTLEVYDKEYTDLPLDANNPARSIIDDGLSNNDFGNYLSLYSNGRAYTRGIEFLIQKKLAKDIYGLISGSYFRSRYQGYDGKWYNRVYDNKIIFSLIGGYKPNEEWEFSVRWTFAGGCPYTPYDIENSKAARYGIIDQNRIMEERYPAYHSLHFRVDKKFFFSNQSLDIYISLWNVYNRKNVADYSWNSEKNIQETSTQWGLLPIIGIEYEL